MTINHYKNFKFWVNAALRDKDTCWELPLAETHFETARQALIYSPEFTEPKVNKAYKMIMEILRKMGFNEHIEKSEYDALANQMAQLD
jgi:hypothetical protein